MVTRNNLIYSLIVLLSLCLLGMDGTGSESDERQRLLEQQKTLHKKIAALKQEREFLLFQREFYGADSKYLLLDFTNSRGQLKYKNRVMKGFHFSTSFKPGSRAVPPGALILTKKIEGSGGKRTLIFGKSLVIQWKSASKTARGGNDIPRIFIAKKDLASIFYAVEEGGMAYVVK